LAEEEPVFESEFSEREADDKALPWEEWPVQPARQALVVVSLAYIYICLLIIVSYLKNCLNHDMDVVVCEIVRPRTREMRTHFRSKL
jgi:hypothetical protein